jgi:hypothetical protein
MEPRSLQCSLHIRHGAEHGGSHLNEIAGPKLEMQGDSVP